MLNRNVSSRFANAARSINTNAHRHTASIVERCAEVLLARCARNIDPHIGRVRGSLTLMLAAAANATATPAPARHAGSRMSHSACLSLQRARGERFRCANGFSAIQPFRLADYSARWQALNSRRCAPRVSEPSRCFRFAFLVFIQISGFQFQHFHPASPSRHLRSVVAPSLGTLPPAPVTDSTFSVRSIRCRTPLHRFRGMLSLIPTVANRRDSQKFIGRVPGTEPKTVARLRPTKTSSSPRASHGHRRRTG